MIKEFGFSLNENFDNKYRAEIFYPNFLKIPGIHEPKPVGTDSDGSWIPGF